MFEGMEGGGRRGDERGMMVDGMGEGGEVGGRGKGWDMRGLVIR